MDQNGKNFGSAITAASIHSIIGSGWVDSAYRVRPQIVEPRHGPSKSKKRSRKAQRQARRNNR